MTSRCREHFAKRPGCTPSARLSLRGQPLQVGEVAQLRRYRPRQVPVVGRGTTTCKLARLPNSAGIAPVNWLRLRYNPPSWRGCPIPPVSHPSTRCRERYNPCKLARLPNSAGIAPVNSLPPRDNPASWRGCPTPPVSPPSTRCRRGPTPASWRGCPTPPVSPVNSLPPRSIAASWRGCPTPTVSWPPQPRWP